MRRRFWLVALPVAATGCLDFEVPLGLDLSGGWGTGPGCYPCAPVILTVQTGFPALLKGDTVRVNALTDTYQRTVTRWTVDESAVRIVDGDSLSSKLDRNSITVLTKGVAAGVSTLRATASDTAFEATLALRVLDSSSIARVDMWAPDTITMKVGEFWGIGVVLVDSTNANVTWYPPLPAIGNTSIVDLMPGTAPAANGYVTLRAKAAGTTSVGWQFRSLRDSAVVIVK